jgi:hypothetical protein
MIGTLVLGALVVYGLFQYNRRNRSNDAVTEAATRELYRDPERYARETKPALDKQVRPS